MPPAGRARERKLLTPRMMLRLRVRAARPRWRGVVAECDRAERPAEPTTTTYSALAPRSCTHSPPQIPNPTAPLRPSDFSARDTHARSGKKGDRDRCRPTAPPAMKAALRARPPASDETYVLTLARSHRSSLLVQARCMQSLSMTQR